jgi:hypothetical protein
MLMKTLLLEKMGVVLLVIGIACLSVVSIRHSAQAAPNSNFTQVINAGTLSVDIVDAGYSTVASPSVAMTATNFSFSCQSSTGTFGSGTEQIYVQNPDAADGGWSLTLAASSTTDVWDSAGTDFDFNDPSGSPAGCGDGGDSDSVAGQMTVDASGGTLGTGQCSSCTTTNVSLGSSDGFEEGSTDSITILSGAAGSDDIGDWTLTGVSISQQIPAEQPAASDYNIDMVLTIASS